MTGLIAYLSIKTNIIPPYNNQEGGCANCLKQVGMAMRMYSDRYDECFPAGKDTPLDSLGLIIETGFLRDAHCLTSHAKSKELTQYYRKNMKIPEELMCYRYNEGLTESSSVDSPVLYYYRPIKWCCYMHPTKEAGRLILFVDGHVKFHPEEEFQEMQKKTLEWIKKKKEKHNSREHGDKPHVP